jgi:hypothetical protein
MCRNIRILNIDPPATKEEIRDAATQYVRKISGIVHPRAATEEAFDRAVDEISKVSAALLTSLTVTSKPRSRDPENGLTGYANCERQPARENIRQPIR